MNLSQLHVHHSEQHSPAQQHNNLRSEMKTLTFYIHNVAFAVVCRRSERNPPVISQCKVRNCYIHVTYLVYMPMHVHTVCCCHCRIVFTDKMKLENITM